MSEPRDGSAGGGPPGAAGSRALPPHLDPRGRRPAPRALSARSVPARGPRPGRAARILSWIAIVASASVLLTSGAGYALLMHYQGNIASIDVFRNLGSGPPGAPDHAENFLIVGSDSRGDLQAGQGTQGVGATYVTGQRSDTVILAHLYGGTSDKVQLVSFPRDSVVDIPAYTDPTTGHVHPAQQNRINFAFSEGGPTLLVDTIQHLTGIRVDHYLQVDFQGFQSMVDKLGGVDVCLAQAAHDHFSGIDLSAGHHHINGTVALAFVRQRHGLPQGDLDRIKRQQQFIGAMVRKVLSAGTLINPLKLNRFLNAATSSLTADKGLGFTSMRDLALRLRNLGAGNVIFTTVPVANANTFSPRLGSVVTIDPAGAAALFDQLRRDVPPGTPTPAATSGSAPLVVAPGSIRLRLYNGSGVSGLARRAATDLTAVGFHTVGQPAARGTGATVTVIRYGPSRSESARTVAAAIPGAQLVAAPELGNVLEVVVGSSYTGAHSVTATTTGAVPPPASAGPKVATALDNPCAA